MNAPKTVPSFELGELHGLLTDSNYSSTLLIDKLAIHQPVAVFAAARNLDSIEQQIGNKYSDRQLQLFDLKHVKRIQANQFIHALDKAVRTTDIIIFKIESSNLMFSPVLLEQLEFYRRLEAWARANRKLVLFFIKSDTQHAGDMLQPLMRVLTSFHVLDESHATWRWSVRFWWDQAVIRHWQWHISLDANDVRQDLHIVQKRKEGALAAQLGERAAKYIASSLLDDQLAQSDWTPFNDLNEVSAKLNADSDAVVVIGAESRAKVRQIAEQIFQLRKYAGNNLRLFVQPVSDELRAQDQRFLTAAGVNIYLPKSLDLREVMTLCESTLGLRYHLPLPDAFADLERVLDENQQQGYLSVADFVQQAMLLVNDARRIDLDCIFIEAKPASGLTSVAVLQNFKSRRQGDLITHSGNKVYLYLHACRVSDLPEVLRKLFRLPVSSLFADSTQTDSYGLIEQRLHELYDATPKPHAYDASLIQPQAPQHDFSETTPATANIRKASYI